MGCSAAKNLAVEPIMQGAANGNGAVPESRKVSIPRKNSDVPPLVGVEPQTEMLDHNSSINKLTKTTNGLSFEIAFEETKEDSIIRKHPPKRLQKLEEQQQSAPPDLSLEKLQEKLDEAEIRRQQILQQRVQSAKHRAGLKRQSTIASEGGESGDENRLKVPPDIPPLDLTSLDGAVRKT